MKKSKEFWDSEYSKGPGFQDLISDKPSVAVQKFVGYLNARGVPLEGKLLDIGCGVGRNASWLAKQGFNVTGIDVSEVAIDKAINRSSNVNYSVCDVPNGLLFSDESFDYVIDILVSQLFIKEDFNKYVKEVMRVLKSSGKLLLCTLDRSVDEEAKRLLDKHPSLEENTYVIPEIGLMERTFTIEEIAKLWFPLKMESAELLYAPSKFEGKIYERYFWCIILTKNSEIESVNERANKI